MIQATSKLSSTKLTNTPILVIVNIVPITRKLFNPPISLDKTPRLSEEEVAEYSKKGRYFYYYEIDHLAADYSNKVEVKIHNIESDESAKEKDSKKDGSLNK